MTTDSFTKNIHHDKSNILYPYYFDEIMVLYNIIGNMPNIKISVNENENDMIFIIKTQSKEDAMSLSNFANGMRFNVYNTKYNIKMNRKKSNLYTSISKE